MSRLTFQQLHAKSQAQTSFGLKMNLQVVVSETKAARNLWESFHKSGQNIHLLLKLGQFQPVSGFSLHKSQINRKVDMTFVTACPW